MGHMMEYVGNQKSLGVCL